MIKIFRKIRLSLLTEKRFTKYLFYALGEIILVVIGILIALAINNANQNRINNNYEQTYLLGLEQEFETSRSKLKELIAVNKSNSNNSKKILEFITYKNETPTETAFSSLLYNTFSSDIAFNPNNSLLNEMINSGNLKNLSNTELRKQLTNWLSTMEDVSRQEKELSVQREKVLDMFRTDKSSLRTILGQTRVYSQIGLPKSKNEVSNLHLLNSTEFENNILMFIFTSYATEHAHYNPIMDDLDTILHLIRKEIE
ncbi:DUF6090 family protein [Salegentibacter sediminis]|uniref:DUF6090 family protein n=1 Tax=Salegentibacter sediminis TaxID=1930251 RepID=UPI001E333FB1|nr:DUF6090 family protein [Salegentibacter sediminis]